MKSGGPAAGGAADEADMRVLRWMLLCLTLLGGAPAGAADLLAFWQRPQHGANCFNETPPDAAYFQALRGYGATWVRLAFSKWKSASGARDFLYGSLDDYRALDPDDLAVLRATLDRAHAAGLKVVLVPLGLPGARWVQLNGDQDDDRLWTEPRYAAQAAASWRDLAAALRGHPAIAAYNLLNEPLPEKHGGLPEHASDEAQARWYAAARGGPRDLPRLYEAVIRRIREVDTATPVMVDAGYYAAADAFGYWPQPLSDARVLYGYHMYEPWMATSAPDKLRKRPLRYPGPLPFAGGERLWDAAAVARYLRKPLDWAALHHIPPWRLVAAEFGCLRTWPDCARYLEDVLTALDARSQHWAFYSFREAWDGMDYELGSGPMPQAYWQAREAGLDYPLQRGPTAVFEPVRKRLAVAR
jgi:hypothetical protein